MLIFSLFPIFEKKKEKDFESYNSRGLRGQNPNILSLSSLLLIQAKTKQRRIILHNSKLYSDVWTIFAVDSVHMNIIDTLGVHLLRNFRSYKLDQCYASNKKLKHTCRTSRKKVTSCSSLHTIVSYETSN